MKDRKLRLIYAAAAVLLLAAEVIIALFVHDDFIRPYFGDVLVVILLYCVVRVIAPRRPVWLPAAIFVFAALVEFSQMIPLVSLLGLDKSAFMRTVMGTSFAWLDIVCYAVGCVLTGVSEFVLHIVRNKNK